MTTSYNWHDIRNQIANQLLWAEQNNMPLLHEALGKAFEHAESKIGQEEKVYTVDEMQAFKMTPEQIGNNRHFAEVVLSQYFDVIDYKKIDAYIDDLVETGGKNDGAYSMIELIGDFVAWQRGNN